MAGVDSNDLVALYEQLKKSMQDADAMIDKLDDTLAQAGEEWRSKGAHEFNDDWNNGFKPSLTKLCQALAMAGSDVAFQHNQMAKGADGAAHNQDLAPVRSAR
jgi:uncharacterized protein YukE